MLVDYDRRSLAGVTAAIVTTAAFAKMFLPFYLVGSTAIFAVASAAGVTLIAMTWRPIYAMTTRAIDILLPLAALYVYVVLNFLFFSRPTIPITHLLGILIFHALFMIFGFAAARSLRTVLMLMLAAAAVYAIFFIRFIVRFGDPEQGGYLRDILGVGDMLIFAAFHQKIGIALALAALAAIGLATNRTRQILAIGAVLLVMYFLFYLSARGALVALACSLAFLAVAGLWVRSKKFTLLSVTAAIVVVALASGLFYYDALQDTDVDQVAHDTITRTIREIQDPDPNLRMQIWARTWHGILAEPDRLLFGRGIGMFPVNEGYGPPDWLLRKTTASHVYPHNVHLEMLYETGIVGLLLFCLVTLSPLVLALRRWRLLSLAQKSAVSMYVFHLVGSEFSGSFGFEYLDQFFFALTVGIVALKRIDDHLAPPCPHPRRTSNQDIPPMSGSRISSRKFMSRGWALCRNSSCCW
jgi:O-antigen ligase